MFELLINLGSTSGGLSLKINGKGFSSSSTVTICNNPCKVINNTFTEINCIVSILQIKLLNYCWCIYAFKI